MVVGARGRSGAGGHVVGPGGPTRRPAQPGGSVAVTLSRGGTGRAERGGRRRTLVLVGGGGAGNKGPQRPAAHFVALVDHAAGAECGRRGRESGVVCATLAD